MRKPAEWMVPHVDERILEYIRDRGQMTPLAISRDGEVERLDVSRTHAGNRMRELTAYGLLCKIDRGLYDITDEGRAYLDEQIDAADLRREQPDGGAPAE